MNLAYLLFQLNIIKRAYHAAQNRPVDSSIIHQEREPELVYMIRIIVALWFLVMTVIALPLFFWQEVFLPPFFVELAYWLKMEVFFERYLHLIREGGLAFADRLFIAYAIVVTIVSISVLPSTIVCAIVVKKYMVPIKRATKPMWNKFILFSLGTYILSHGYFLFGEGLDDTGLSQATDWYLNFTYPVLVILLPGLFFVSLANVFIWIYVLFDGWREGRLRALFQTAPPPQGEN